jgi:hypothetical protein
MQAGKIELHATFSRSVGVSPTVIAICFWKPKETPICPPFTLFAPVKFYLETARAKEEG